MEEQKLELVPEVINDNIVEETEIITEEAHVDKEEVRKEEDEDDEEFYEKIEAPKFIDFTKPYPFRTDDRYWFCSRVGCDLKHEEEIDHEEISKNFVLRVLAARSPNIKLRRALNREHSSIKCPLSAPAKPSKPRIPRLEAIVSSSITQKICDPQSNSKPRSKVGSTPVVRSRQVAAKYMTTPRNKKCPPNPNSFQSVPNTKTTSVSVPKNRMVAKALVFHSPKKVISLKKSVELHTPLKRICEGMKKLDIASQKRTPKSIKSKPKKPEAENSSRLCKGNKKSKDLVPSKSTKTPNKKVVENESGSTSDFTKKEEDLQLKETSDTSISHALNAETNFLQNLEDKENLGSAEDHSNEEQTLEDKENMASAEVHSNEEQTEDHSNKENALIPEDNNRINNQPLGDKILGKETHKKNKVVQTTRPAVSKCKKPKPTNVKPFRLRTDERGILKEANKLHLPVPEKVVAKDISVIKKTYRIPKNEKLSTEQRKHNDSCSDDCGKESSGVTSTSDIKMQVGSKPVPKIAPRPGSTASLRTRSQQPQGIRRPGQQLSVIKEKSCTLTGENKTRAASAAKRPVTIAKEPNFHSSHLPRSCSKKTA